LKLAYVDICGFRGYRHAVRLEFADAFTIIDGRNGVGKSTIFDAVEFALTGELSKYRDAKAAGETVADYVWWTGSGEQPADRYVEVGFKDANGIFAIKRTQFNGPSSDILQALTAKLSEFGLSPSAPLKQLCSASIIRDEHIAELSLDLKEADRYALVRDALGANDAEKWISRAASLVAAAKKRAASAQQEVTAINGEAAMAARRVDEIRASIVDESVLAESIARLQTFASASQLSPDQLGGPARARIAEVNSHMEIAQTILPEWEKHISAQHDLNALVAAAHNAEQTLANENESLAALFAPETEMATSALADKARSLVALVSSGREIGLVDGGCPLCASKLTMSAFEQGLRRIQALAVEIDDQAAKQAEAEAARLAATRRRDQAAEAAAVAQARVSQQQLAREKFERDLERIGLAPGVAREDVIQRIEEFRSALEVVQRDLRIVGTLRFSTELEKSRRLEADIQLRLGRAQEKFSRARKAEATAHALHDAARRAAAESLDRRLDRVLPLMAELYRRLRPHPIWRDIEYSIRGDVKRFLKLQVGDELNPQFLFSSGQRRATGLAFLLSVNVSLAWSRWRSILLDDPVQHVDDFRTIHLAEVLAQLVGEGRQIICSVEDPALADLLCRRLPVSHAGEAKRVTLGLGMDGSSAKIAERALNPFVRRTLVVDSTAAALG
jgi:chromosome segregation protein